MAGRKSRTVQLRESRIPVLAMLTPAVALIFGAAVIEAFVSPSALGIPVRLGVAVVSLIVVAALAAASLRKRREVPR
jgi:hypothetical protein